MNIIKIGITYNTPTYIYFWNRLVEAVKIFLVKSPPICNFTTLPDTASLLHPCNACTWWGELCSLFFYCNVNSFPTVNSLPTMNSMTHALWKSSPRYLTQLCCCTPCDTRTSCGELRSPFFYWTVNSFLTMNSLPTVNSVTHALWKTSPRYLTQLRCCTPCDARTSCGELCSLFFYCIVNSFPTVISLLTMNSVAHALWKTSPLYLTQLRCCTLCDTRTSCGELCSLFFYCIVNSFPTVTSLPTVNSVKHALKETW